jgi:hypothetical protein
MGGDFLLAANSAEINSGTAVIPWDTAKDDHDIGTPLYQQVFELTDDEVEARFQAGQWWHTLHVLEMDITGWHPLDQGQPWNPVDTTKGPGWLPVHYAWWPGEGGPMGVVTTRNIFIMGETGQTIARVR